MDIKGILFDSGDTLVFPKAGSWWPGFKFDSILLRHGIPVPEKSEVFDAALEEGLSFLDTNHFVTTRDEELAQFRMFYQIICKRSGISYTDLLIEDLASTYVDECNFQLYPDTIFALETLYCNGFTLGILSDAWPSLRQKYEYLGITRYFRSFTISAEAGHCKPDEVIYRRAIEQIGIEPNLLLFIDDDPDNVTAAIDLGMNGILMARDKDIEPGRLPIAHGLNDVLALMNK